MPNRFFVRMKERPCFDAQERAAIHRHRLAAVQYHASMLEEGHARYAFFAGEGLNEAILMYEIESHDRLDWLIKRDPLFPYTTVTVIPTITTEALVREAQDYLGEEIFSKAELPKLTFAHKKIDPNAEYWLAWKEVLPFSPLCPVAEQDDVHRRTVIAQKGHFEDLEFSDENPVGRPVGILVAQGSVEDMRRHVESCEVFPDTVVQYTRLYTHRQTVSKTIEELRRLRRPIPEGLEGVSV